MQGGSAAWRTQAGSWTTGIGAVGVTAQIWSRLVLSPLTVKTHVNRAMMKLGARDRAQLVVIAYRCGVTAAPSS